MHPDESPSTQPVHPPHGAPPQTYDGPMTVTPARPGQLIRLPRVMEITCLSKSSTYAKVKDGTFPAPVRLSARMVAWRETDVYRWVSERVSTGGQS
jgi:prophage regulatory protein